MNLGLIFLDGLIAVMVEEALVHGGVDFKNLSKVLLLNKVLGCVGGNVIENDQCLNYPRETEDNVLTFRALAQREKERSWVVSGIYREPRLPLVEK